MATTAVETGSTNVLATQETYVKVKDTTDGGKIKVYPESEEIDKKIEEGEFEEVGRQSATFYSPQSLEGVEELVPDADERLSLVKRALRNKLQNKIRTTVLKEDYAFVEGSVDLREACNEKSQERGLSDTEKLIKNVKNLPADQLAQVMAVLARIQAEQANTVAA